MSTPEQHSLPSLQKNSNRMDENLSGNVDSSSAVSNMYGNHNSQNATINHGPPVPSVALKNSMLTLPPQVNVTSKSQSLSSVNTTNGTGRKYQCKMCPQIFMHKSAMQYHSREAHKGDIKPYQCQQCLKSFSSNHQLIQHIRIHTGEKPYKCSYCDRRFKQLSHVQQHTRLHTGERPYKCHLPECARAFIQLSNLQQHLRNHDSQVERAKNRPFVCSICGKNFATESNLRTHNSKQHVSLIGVTFPQTCPVCHKSFINAEALMEHMNVVHKNTNASGDPSKKKISNHQCPLCGKTYVNEGSLRKHIATHPETSSIASAPLRMWPCTVCQNVFTQETGLLHHMETMRTDPRHQFAAQYLLSRAAAERREKHPNTSSAPSLPTSTSVAISNVHLQPLNVMSTCDTVMPEAPASLPPPQTGVSAINCSSNSSSDTDITTSPSATKSPLPEQLTSHQQHFQNLLP